MPQDLHQYAESLAKPLEILIVDDDPEILNMLRHIFEQYNVCCTFAQTVEYAIQAVNTKPFSIVFLDLVFKGELSGVDFLRHVRRAAPALPVVVMTGHVDSQAARESVDLGVEIAHFMRKPMAMNDPILTDLFAQFNLRLVKVQKPVI